jgi:hypothetical protein
VTDAEDKAPATVVVDPNRITLRLTVIVSMGFALWTAGNTWVNLTRDVARNTEQIDEVADELEERVEELEEQAQGREVDFALFREKIDRMRGSPPPAMSLQPSSGGGGAIGASSSDSSVGGSDQ